MPEVAGGDPGPGSGAEASGNVADALARHLEGRLGRPVARIATHLSWVLLDGEHAWKIRKPVAFGFVDFSSLERRRLDCHEEIRLNRRLAPDLYLDVVPIFGREDRAGLEDDGSPPIEYAVRMKQFSPDALLSGRVAAGTLEPRTIDRLAERLAAFHLDAPRVPPDAAFGNPQAIGASVLAVLDGIEQCSGQAHPLRPWIATELKRLQPVFKARREGGWVRECHGDLHLANTVDLGKQVTGFDCLEFDASLRWIDVQSDIAFPVMDLLAYHRRDLAFRLLDGWLGQTGDHEGLPVLRFYMIYRALVRDMVARLTARETATAARGQPDYHSLALALAGSADPRMLITFGLSGSGKTWLSGQLLERVGAIRLRSDVERKRLSGLDALERSGSGPGAGIYRPEDTRRTYDRLLELALIALDAGYPVIVDAAFLRREERSRFRQAARARAIPFRILRCQASAETLRERVEARRRGGRDASEADITVLERQQDTHDPLDGSESAVSIGAAIDAQPDAAALAGLWLAASAEVGAPDARAPQ
jgi:uncharacterized protein